MGSLLEALAKELEPVLRNKALPSGSPVGPYLHGPGGLFGVPGISRDVISTRVQTRGLASALPARGTNDMQPLYPYITGFMAPTGSNPNGVCDDPQTAGPIKNCLQTAQFGRYSYQTREFELNRAGQRSNRGEFMDLQLVNPPLVSDVGGITTPATASGGRVSLASEMAMRMVEVGVSFQDKLVRQVYTGNPANNTGGGGYKEFMGLDILIGTTKVDAQTGTPCPSLRSDIKAFNYQNISTSGGQSIVNVLTYMMRMLRHNAERMNMGGTTWAITMRQSLFWELTAVWPCAYMTYRCAAQDNTQTQLVIDANDQLAMRDDMRNGMYLIIDGVRYPVIIDDGIVEENRADNANIPIVGFASDIYIVPLTIRDGSMAATFWEYFDFSADNAAMADARVSGYTDQYFWTDGGRYLWHRKPPLNWCVQMLAKVEPRLVLLTPHLAGRVTDVVYVPLQHERDSINGDDYFIDGGVQSRSATRLYSDWSSTTPYLP
jgi:hypothetical protein